MADIACPFFACRRLTPAPSLLAAKKLPDMMVLASYQLPAEPAILHEVVAKYILERLQPLLDEAGEGGI